MWENWVGWNWNLLTIINLKTDAIQIIIFVFLFEYLISRFPAIHFNATCDIRPPPTQKHCDPGSRKHQTKLECIPVGCVPSAAVAVCWGGGCLPAKGVSDRGCLPGGMCLTHTLVKTLPFRNFVCGR